MRISHLAAALSLVAQPAFAQETAPQEDLNALLARKFDIASAEKIICNPNIEKLPCVMEAYKKALASNKTVVAFHVTPERPTISVVFPDGIVMELEPDTPEQNHYSTHAPVRSPVPALTA